MYLGKTNKHAETEKPACLFREKNVAHHYKMVQDKRRYKEKKDASCSIEEGRTSGAGSIFSMDQERIGTIIIHYDKECYTIEQYSREAAGISGGKDLGGRDLFHNLEFSAKARACLKRLVKEDGGRTAPPVFLNISINSIDSRIILKCEKLLPYSSGRLLITFYVINSDDFHIAFQNITKKNSIRISDVRLFDLESRGFKPALPSCDQKGQKGCFYEDAGRGLNKKRMNEEILKELTRREREILFLVLEGNTNKFISAKLLISEGTVKKTISNVYRKLNVSSRIELAMLLLSD